MAGDEAIDRRRLLKSVTVLAGAAVAGTSLAQAYQNFIDPALPNWQTAYYGQNLPRLVQAKHDWDPDNAFTFAQAVPEP